MIFLVGVVIGLVLGLTGAGGSLFAVPLLMILLGLPFQEATGIALAAVAVSALFGILLKRGQDIVWAPSLIILAGGILAAPLGRWVGRYLEGPWLLILFSLLIVWIAASMWRQARRNPEGAEVTRSQPRLQSHSTAPPAVYCRQTGNRWDLRAPCLIVASLGGLATGFLSGLLGVGGGFLIVPLLNMVAGLNMRQAVSSSLLIISLVSSSGFVSYYLLGTGVDGNLLIWVGLGGLVGMLIGANIGSRVAGAKLQQTFAVLLVLTLLAMWLKV